MEARYVGVAVQFALVFALILGWAVGAGLEAAWRDRGDTSTDWEAFAYGVLPRLIGGIAVFFVVVGIEFGFEAMGVGLGSH